MIALAFGLILLLPQEPQPDPPVERVLVISVDGLRSDAIELPLPGVLPAFDRLRRGAHTLNARCDRHASLTNPNHIGMLTGRPLYGETGHRIIHNSSPYPGETLHLPVQGEYFAGIFDVAHDRGLRTALYTGKAKFALFERSWNAKHGAADEFPPDHGRDKLDEYLYSPRLTELSSGAVQILSTPGRSLVFWHIAITDEAGHYFGWELSPASTYMQAVARVDLEIQRLLAQLEQSPRGLEGLAIVLTSDHGGGSPFMHHHLERMAINYTVPLLVWINGEETPRDLYALNMDRRADPGREIVAQNSALGPIRNRDVANLALDLLGLPPVPGSPVASEPVLRARPARNDARSDSDSAGSR